VPGDPSQDLISIFQRIETRRQLQKGSSIPRKKTAQPWVAAAQLVGLHRSFQSPTRRPCGPCFSYASRGSRGSPRQGLLPAGAAQAENFVRQAGIPATPSATTPDDVLCLPRRTPITIGSRRWRTPLAALWARSATDGRLPGCRLAGPVQAQRSQPPVSGIRRVPPVRQFALVPLRGRLAPAERRGRTFS